MRKTLFAVSMAVGVAAGMSIAAAADPVTYGPVPAKPTWTERIKTTLTTNPFAKKPGSKPGPASAAPERQELDPISLAFNSGPATPQLYVAMADMACRGGNVDQGRQMYQKALSMEPNHLPALIGAARMEDRAGRLDVAHDLYHRAATAEPKNTTVLNDLALCLARRGQIQPARQVLEQAIQLEPTKPLYRNNMAKVLIELNQMDAAVAQLSAVHAPAVAQYNMGVLLRDRGRAAESAKYFAAALSLDPQMEAARTLLAQVSPASPSGGPAQQPVYQVARATQSATYQSTAQTPVSPAGTPAVVGNPYMQTAAPPITPTPGVAPQYTVPLPTSQPPATLPPIN